MIRIGLIGTESTHCGLISGCVSGRGEEAVVASVLEDGDGTGLKLARERRIGHVAFSPEEMLPHVDAVMICCRRAARRVELARYMLDRGKSVWLDKPLADTVLQIRALYLSAAEKRLTLSGGSVFRFAESVRRFGAYFAAHGEALAAGFNYSSLIDSEYDGISFYGPHSLCILQTAFGADVRSVTALRQGKSVVAAARYDGHIVSMQLSDCAEAVGSVYMPDHIERFDLSLAGAFDRATADYLLLCQEGRSADYDALAAPVALLNTLRRSLASGREETIEPWRL